MWLQLLTRGPATRSVIAAVTLAVSPGFAGNAAAVYVSNERAGTVSVLDGATLAVKATWPVGKRPRGIHLSPDGATLYVAVSGSPRLGPGADPERAKDLKADKSADGIAVVDAHTGQVKHKVSVGSDPEEFALSGDGRTVFVSNEDDAAASAWNVATGRRIFSTPVSEEPEGVTLHPSRAELYVTCENVGDVFVLDATTGRALASIRVGGRPRSVAFSGNGKVAYVPLEAKAEVAAIDATTHRLAFTIPIPGAAVMPMAAVLSRDGAELFVSTGRGNAIAVIDLARHEVVATIQVGQRVWGIALSPDGRTLFTANGASNDVSVIDIGARKEIKRVPVGDGPWGVAVGAGSR
jgi:YVTN family beta-propeller protein